MGRVSCKLDTIVPAGTMCRIAGWGNTMSYWDDPDKLQAVDLPILSHRDCADEYGPFDEYNSFCAGFPEGGKTYCGGDGGGAIICDGVIEGRDCARSVIPFSLWTVHADPQKGVIPWNNCTGLGIFSRVAAATDWIIQNTKKY